MLKLKGLARWEYIQREEARGVSGADIAKTLGITHGSFRVWKSGVKGKYLKTNIQPSIKPPPVTKRIVAPFTPTNTIKWEWDYWTNYFLAKQILKHQYENLNEFDIGLTKLNDPRQHGKTVYCVEPFITRKLCEQQFYNADRPILYMSHGNRNVRKMINTARISLMTNDKILKHYGDLVDFAKLKRAVKASQTQFELNLTSLIDPQLISLCGTTVDSGIRGGNYYYTIIDDPVDPKEVAEGANLARLTADFMEFFTKKILPLAKGIIIIIGTRYMIKDLYAQLEKLRVFRNITRKAIIGKIPGYTIPDRGLDDAPIQPKDLIVHDTLTMLAPELWKHQPGVPMFNGTAAQNIMFRHYIMGNKNFMQELQNDPLPSDRAMKFDWLREYVTLPAKPTHVKHLITIDTSAGESEKADYNAFAYVASYKRNHYIVDLLHGKWSPLEKARQLETFVDNCARNMGIDSTTIEVRIEVVRSSGMDFYRLLLEHSWIAAKKSSPVGRGKKADRIANNLGGEAESGRIWISNKCRFTNVLTDEFDSFPYSNNDHYMDAIDQAVWLRRKGKSNKDDVVSTSSTFDIVPGFDLSPHAQYRQKFHNR